jgi:minor extracellular serine protease Vpr
MMRAVRTPRRAHGLVVAVAAALVALAVTSVASGAGAAGTAFKTVPGGGIDNLTPAQMPIGASNAPVTYILQLPGDPVAVVDANSKDSGNGPLSKGDKAQLTQQLKAQQSPVIQAVQNLGGTVTGSFQTVYNGVAVVIPARDAWKLATIQGVSGVFRGRNYTLSNIHGVPLIGAPQAWDGVNGFHGEGMKIGDIDTGIDYTHADFGGPGNPADYTTARSADTLPANPLWFGPAAPKVKGGIDLVGDSYNASSSNPADLIPHPDLNPLDCNGHGTHTAGTAAGFGVLDTGQTYTGPYNLNTISSNSWNVGPGVAPKADIYAIRVFGCNGSVDDAVLIQAMDWAVQNGMDAINMSLGAPFGNSKDPDSVAASNTAKDGVIVVSASGNNGNAPYITSSPGAGTNGISVAANDPTQSFPGATLSLSTGGPSITAIDANGFQPIPSGPLNIKVIFSAPNVISLGCSVAADGGANSLPPNTVIVVARGTCARVAKAIFGQQAGAAAVVMVNNSTGLPPFEGKITNDPDPPGPPLFGGFNYTVTIPFLGVRGGSNPSNSTNGIALRAADGGTMTLTSTTITNTAFKALASFSSWGPSGDGTMRPEVTAPGVSIASAGMGTGSEAVIESGTSMATPHTSGMSLLVKQAHPDWKKVEYWKDAIVNTANPAGVTGFVTRGAGAGLIQAWQATHTQVVASGDPKGTASLSFGVPAIQKDFAGKEHIKLRNFGSTPATFNISDTLSQGAAHSIVLKSNQVTIPAHADKDVEVELDVPLGSAADPVTSFGDWFGAGQFDDVSGDITFTPATSNDNSGIPLNVPYYAVPTAVSSVKVHGIDSGKFEHSNTVNATITNEHGGATGYADWFAWSGKDSKAGKQLGSADLLSVGVQSFPGPTLATSQLVFGIHVNRPWTNPAEDEFDVLVDVNGDGTPDYDVVSVDFGALTAGSSNGEAVVAVITLATGQVSVRYLTGAMFNGTTMELPVDFDQLCRSGQPCISASTPIDYNVFSFDRNGGSDTFNSVATYNAFHPVFSNNFEDVVAPGDTASDTTTIDPTAWGANPQLGLLVLAQNNQAHENHDEAFTIPVH